MVRRLEFPAAWSSLRTLDTQLGSETRHFVLLNDERDPELERALAQRPHTELLVPGRNLGVAAGRNRLIAAALAWGADLIVPLDDDLLVPDDYVSRIRDWIEERTAGGDRVGIVAPAILDFHAVAERIMSREAIEDAEEGRLSGFPDTATLRTRIAAAWDRGPLPVDAVYHAGIRNWRSHYLDSYSTRPAFLRELYLNVRGIRAPDVGINELRLDPEVRKAIVTGEGQPMLIHTAAGGACAYTADLVRAIGGVDEAFSPFGYEDSDYAVRALAANFHNYTLPTEIVLHDLDSRQKRRSPSILLHSQGRARALMARKHIPARERGRAITELATLAPLQAVDVVGATLGRFPSVTGAIIGSVVAYFGGFLEGMFTAPTEPDITESSTTATYRPNPHTLERSIQIQQRIWDGTPPSGLPEVVHIEVTISYRWDERSGRLTLNRLIADSPGLFRLKASAEIEQVGSRDELGNPDPLSTRLNRLTLEFEDWGFLRRFETTAAWFRSERTAGYLAALLQSPFSRTAKEIRTFFSLRTEPARLMISVQPGGSVTVRELFELTPGTNLTRRLGIRTTVKTLAHF